MQENPQTGGGKIESPIESPWMTIKEAAARVRLKPGTLRNYISKKKIPVHRNPSTGMVRLKVGELDDWIQGKTPK